MKSMREVRWKENNEKEKGRRCREEEKKLWREGKKDNKRRGEINKGDNNERNREKTK